MRETDAEVRAVPPVRALLARETDSIIQGAGVMKLRWNHVVSLSVLAVVIALPSIVAAPIVEIRLNTRFAMAPATIRVMVVVEPHAANRMLRVALDGDGMFSSSDIALEGADEKRVHELYFKSVPAGHYAIVAEVLAARAVRGSAVERLNVISMEP